MSALDFGNTGSTMEVKYEALTDPLTATGHAVKYRISAPAGNLTVSLRRPVRPHSQANAITDYTDLRLRVVSSQ